jgi:hypothetical protein
VFSPTRIWKFATRLRAANAQLDGIRADGCQNIERGADRSFSIVLVRDRSAEERQHAIAQQLCNGALVPINRFAHTLMRARDDLAPLFGIALLGQRSRSDDVGEQCRDQPAFTCGPRACPEFSRRRFAGDWRFK